MKKGQCASSPLQHSLPAQQILKQSVLELASLVLRLVDIATLPPLQKEAQLLSPFTKITYRMHITKNSKWDSDKWQSLHSCLWVTLVFLCLPEGNTLFIRSYQACHHFQYPVPFPCTVQSEVVSWPNLRFFGGAESFLHQFCSDYPCLMKSADICRVRAKSSLGEMSLSPNSVYADVSQGDII